MGYTLFLIFSIDRMHRIVYDWLVGCRRRLHRREIRSYFLWIEMLKTVCWRKRAELPLFFFLLCGIAVLPCFSASGKVPVTRCGLPLRGTYAAYWPSSRLDCHTLMCSWGPQAYQPATLGLNHKGDASPRAVFSGHCHFHVSHDERSHSVRALPGLLCKRLDSNQRQKPDICLAPLYPTELRLHI